MSRFDDLVRDYRVRESELSEREKAELEASIWDAGADADRNMDRREYLDLILGGGKKAHEYRYSLQRLGLAANPLWDRIERKVMTLSAAATIVTEIKAKARNPHDLTDLIANYAKEYDRLPFVRHLPNGYIVRAGGPGSKESKKEKAGPRHEPVGEAKAEVPVAEDDRFFWKWVRNQIGGFIKRKLAGVDPIEAERITRHFEIELSTAIGSMQNRVSRVVDTRRKLASGASLFMNRSSVREACQVLAIDPPAAGKAVDLDKAQRKKKQLAHLYHPDKHGGDESLRPKYEAVMAAYSTLEEYNRMLPIPIGDERKESDGNGGNDDDGR